MSQTDQTNKASQASGKSADEPSTSTAGGGKHKLTRHEAAAAAANASAPDWPRKRDENGVMDGHKMEKKQFEGADHWFCKKCGYTTDREVSALEHQDMPY